MVLVAATAVASSLLPALALPAAATGSPAASSPTISITPTSGLTDGQDVHISARGLQPREALLAVECSPAALSIGEDGCENHRNAVFLADGAGTAAARLVVTSTISTAVGAVSCMTSTCLLGVVKLPREQILTASAIRFSSTTCHGGTNCEDAPPVPTTRRTPGRAAPVPMPSGGHAIGVAPGSPRSLVLAAALAGNLHAPSAVTGPAAPADRHPRMPSKPVTGEGLLQLTMRAPGTSWASATDKAVVVQARVGSGPWQQIVLFAGARPFTYAGFAGALTTGRHRLTVRVNASLSTTGRHIPVVRLLQARLRVVAPSNPSYLLERYAPVVFGRSDSASSDTQLLTYGTVTPLGAGSFHLAYETVWTHEDAGTSFVPLLEWGEWGRMTDITATASLDVSASGAISDPMYNWCGCGPGFPQNRVSLQEVMKPFTGRYYDKTHMIVRNASGNDYQSEVGTTRFRFQQAAVTGPASGESRDEAMDASPWTYRFMEQEIRYWYLDRSTNPLSPQPGVTAQYAIVDLDTSSAGVSAIGVGLRLGNSTRWYRNDFGSGIPLFTGGHHRTVVKLPVGWQRSPITGVELRVSPASAASSLTVSSFEVLALDNRYRVHRVPTPSVQVVPAAASALPRG